MRVAYKCKVVTRANIPSFEDSKGGFSFRLLHNLTALHKAAMKVQRNERASGGHFWNIKEENR